LPSVLRNEDNCWSEFYKYVKRRKGNRENIPSNKDHNGTIITDTTEKCNILNSYYASVFCCDRNISEIKVANPGETIINTNVIRKRLKKIWKNKSEGPDGIPGQILKLGGVAMAPYLARLLEISLNNASIPSNWKRATVLPTYKGGDRSAVSNYRPISLTSVVRKQLEQLTAGYLRQFCHKNDWLYEGQHGFRLEYSRESQVITVCQDRADPLDEGVVKDAIIIDFSKVFDSIPHDRQLTTLAASGVDSWVEVWVREFLVSHTRRVRVGGKLSKEVKVTSAVPQGSDLGPLLFLVYVNDIWRNIDSSIRLFADDCITDRKITNKNDMENFQKDLDTLGEWAVENGMKINTGKCKAIRLTRTRLNTRWFTLLVPKNFRKRAVVNTQEQSYEEI